MIAIISADNDVHAQAVISKLVAKGGSYCMIDLSKYPSQSKLTINYDAHSEYSSAKWQSEATSVDFEDCRVIWWRRPQPFEIDSTITDIDNKNFAFVEAMNAFAGLWLTLDAYWINHPTRDEEAARKVYQLKVAQQVGLRIPDTSITSDIEEARRFINRHGVGQTVYKAFSGTEQAWRETRLIKQEELDLISGVRYAPVIFQEYIPLGLDFRITVVGDKIFPAAINSRGTEYEVDFRMVMESAQFENGILPAEVTASLHALMRKLGLVYGAIDMRQTPEGEFVFLEINPAGQWLFVEERTGQPITQALADLMLVQD